METIHIEKENTEMKTLFIFGIYGDYMEILYMYIKSPKSLVAIGAGKRIYNRIIQEEIRRGS